MSDTIITELISRYAVIPVIAVESEEAALPLADALIAGGLPVAEITFRTTAAAAVISRLSKERPQLLLGAGTVLTMDSLRAAKTCGAQFAVAPGLNPAIAAGAQELGIPFIPGVATPSDIEQGLAAGCRLLKLFPAEVLGGVAMVKALSGPYAHTGVRFVPTGGVNAANLESYLSLKTVAAVGGTWLATKEDLVDGRWALIQNRCAAALDIVRRIRG